MTFVQFQAAFMLAQSEADLAPEYHQVCDLFDGFGLRSFQPVTVTTRQLAALIRWQALYLNGQWDNEALDEVRRHGARKFFVADCPGTAAGAAGVVSNSAVSTGAAR